MKRPRSSPTDVSTELAGLKHTTTQNKSLPKLPQNTTVTRRPINHAPIASPRAGANVPKVVYVSRKTPLMSAVKRVKKFLNEFQKRAMQSGDVTGVLERRSTRGDDVALQRRLGEVSEKLARDAEEVLVKASGRAMEQALRVAEWFRGREEEVLTKVEVRVGSVSVVDDIVEKDEDDGGVRIDGDDDKENDGDAELTALEGGDTTIELLRNLEKGDQDGETHNAPKPEPPSGGKVEVKLASGLEARQQGGLPKKKRQKRKRKEYDPDDMPEARLRWVKTIEVAISLRA